MHHLYKSSIDTTVFKVGQLVTSSCDTASIFIPRSFLSDLTDSAWYQSEGFWVIVGVIVSGLIGLLVEISREKRERKNLIIEKQLIEYQELASLLGRHFYRVFSKQSEKELGIYPAAFESLESCRLALNEMVLLIDGRRFFIEKEVADSFAPLNELMLNCINSQSIENEVEDTDHVVRKFGRDNRDKIQCEAKKMWDKIKSTVKREFDYDMPGLF